METHFGMTLVLFLLLALGGWFYFRWYRRSQAGFKARIQDFKECMETHRLQIERRGRQLDRYDFLQYNLTDVLIAEPAIDLSITDNR